MALLDKNYKKLLVLLLAAGTIVSLAAYGTAQKDLPEQPSAENAQVNTAESDSDKRDEQNRRKELLANRQMGIKRA